jgi:protein-disulfide isomerase
LRQINETYIQTGLVRFGYVHFAILGEESIWAAEASECAAEQDQFWAFHDLLFNLLSQNKRGFSRDELISLAGQSGLDQDAFSTCLNAGKYKSVISQQTQLTQSIGVHSTPTFIVNNQPLVGAQGFDAFQQVIEAELDKVGR